MTRLIQITAYVRDEAALAKWKAIPNKTEWLNEHLYATKWESKGVRIKKAKAGTIDPMTGLEIDEFRFNTPEVQNIVDSMYAPPEETA